MDRMDEGRWKPGDESVDIMGIMDAVAQDEPLTDLERRVVLASLILWQLVPPHTRDALLEDHIQAMAHELSATSTAVN